MSKTHIGTATTTPYSIYFQYYPNTTDYPDEVVVVDSHDTENGGAQFHGKDVKVVASVVTVSGYGTAIKSITTPVIDMTYQNGVVWGRVDVHTFGSGATPLRSKLKILCQPDGQTALYREVVFTVMEKQRFNNGIDSSVDAIEDAFGQSPGLHLRIPSDLPKDLFPLQVRIESQANNLTSVSGVNNGKVVDPLPVQHGPSVFDTGLRSFYFVKTINWDEYAHLSGETYSYTTEFPCYFTTTKETGNTTSISLQDLNLNSQGVNQGKYFYEMVLPFGPGITVSPSSQTVNHDQTSATVSLAASSAWTLGAHDGLRVASGSPTSGEAGNFEITFEFDQNDTQAHKEYSAVFATSDDSATATIVQTALVPVPVTRTIAVNNTTFYNQNNQNSQYVYRGQTGANYTDELGISFDNVTGSNGTRLELNRTGSTVKVEANAITSIVFTWTENGRAPTSATLSGGETVPTQNTTTTYTNASGSNSVQITFSRNNNNTLRLRQMVVTYKVYEEQ